MKSLTVVFAIVMGLAGATVSNAQNTNIRGDWTVREMVETTYTLDGKDKLKGPFRSNPKDNHLRITDYAASR